MKAKYYLLVCCFCVISNISYGVGENDTIAAKEQLKCIPKNVQFPSNWSLYSEINGVTIYYKLHECDEENSRYIFFKLENSTSNTISVSWNVRYYFNENCLNCGIEQKEEYKMQVQLHPSEELETNCFNNSLALFHSFIERAPGMSLTELTNFELVGLQVNSNQ